MVRPTRNSLVHWPLVFFLTLGLTISVVSSRAQESRFAGQDISVVLVGSGRSQALPGIPLDTVSVPVKQGDTIDRLLAARHIVRDGGSLSLVYMLNPDLTDVNSLPLDHTIALPIAMGSDEVKNAFERGDMAVLVVDQKQKTELVNTVTSLQNISTKISGLEAGRFEDPQNRQPLLDSADNLLRWLGIVRTVIRENNVPLSTEIVKQLSLDAQVLNNMLQGAVSSSSPVKAVDVRKIQLIEADVRLKMPIFDEEREPGKQPKRYREVKVRVRTLKPGKGGEINKLRVWYVPEWLQGDPTYEAMFEELSSPAHRPLPEADYVLWAAKADDKEHKPITDLAKAKVRVTSDGTEFPVDLLLGDGGKGHERR